MQHMNRRELTIIATFVFFAFAITWGTHALVALLPAGRGVEVSNEHMFRLFLDIFSARATDAETVVWVLSSLTFGPTFAAFITAAIYEGLPGVRALLKRMISWKASPRSVLLAFGIPVGMGVVALLIGYISSGFTMTAFTPVLPWGYLVPFALYMIVFTGLAEEVGWRGFLQERLQRRFNLYKASVIVGIIWGIWHFPFQIGLFLDQPVVLVFSLVGLMAGIAGWSIVVGWLYVKSGSLPLIFVLHGWSNVITSYLITSSGNYTASVVYAILPWAIVYVLERTQRDVLYE
ncbi:MAG: CPBP family intramembrane glutamic endopeptidase [Patescibacteria group bacterium]